MREFIILAGFAAIIWLVSLVDVEAQPRVGQVGPVTWACNSAEDVLQVLTGAKSPQEIMANIEKKWHEEKACGVFSSEGKAIVVPGMLIEKAQDFFQYGETFQIWKAMIPGVGEKYFPIRGPKGKVS
jgi:hypothetical protein